MEPTQLKFPSDVVYSYMDISLSGKPLGRLVFELFTKDAPFAAYNFYHSCVGTKIPAFERTITYEGNFFHRVIKNFMLQAGDIQFCSGKFELNDNVGKGGCSIYAQEAEFKDESLELPCYGNFIDENLGEFKEPFLLAMANAGKPNTNSSQFFITGAAQPHLNGKHSIFGKVIYGKSIIRVVENVKVDSDGFPAECIRIEKCGAWDKTMDVPLYNASNNPIGGDIFEEYPDDDTHFNQEDFTQCYLAADTIKNSGTLLFKQKNYQEAFYKYRKSLSYVNEFIPDEGMDAELNKKFNLLKMKLYLNICLVKFNQGELDESIKYATYLLNMENVPDIDQAKAYYRRGNCQYNKKRFEDALKDYKQCQLKNENDKAVEKKIEIVQDILDKEKEKTKKNLSKFFK